MPNYSTFWAIYKKNQYFYFKKPPKAKGPPLVGEEARKKVGTYEVDGMMLYLRWWQDVGLSMTICLILYSSHNLSLYTILSMSWLVCKSDEFNNRDCLPATWWVSCRMDGWHVEWQIKSMQPQIIEVRFNLLITPKPPIGVHCPLHILYDRMGNLHPSRKCMKEWCKCFFSYKALW